jgi:hypothetical protein
MLLTSDVIGHWSLVGAWVHGGGGNGKKVSEPGFIGLKDYQYFQARRRFAPFFNARLRRTILLHSTFLVRYSIFFFLLSFFVL